MDPTLPQTAPELVLREERLALGADRVPVERVRLQRRITTEVRQVDVTVRREELVLERSPLDDGTTGSRAPGQSQPLVIVLSEEVPVVQVVTRPYERVSVHVDSVVTGEQQVSASLGREVAELVEDGAGQAGRTSR